MTPLLAALFLLASSTRTFTVFQGHQVAVAVPDGWTFADSRESDTGVQTLALEDPSGEIKLRLSFFPDSENRLGSKGAIEATMKKYFAAMLNGAVEREMKIVSSDTPGGFEGHTLFTDKQFAGREVPKDERRLATAGVRSWPGVFGIFTILSNQAESATYKTALDVVRTSVKFGEAIRQVQGDIKAPTIARNRQAGGNVIRSARRMYLCRLENVRRILHQGRYMQGKR